MSLPGSNTAMLASSGTITISEEAIAAFVARYGTNLVCYIEGYEKEGISDENPCSEKSDCDKINEDGLKSGGNYEDWMGEWDEACGFSGNQYGINRFSCNEQLHDYRVAKCEYERQDLSDEEKSEWAFKMRYYACVSAKHGCAWGKFVLQFEGSIQAMLIAESARKCKTCVILSCLVGWLKSIVKNAN